MDFFTQAELRKHAGLIEEHEGLIAEAADINESHKRIGSMMTSSSRQSVYSTGEWSSSGPWTTYYNTWQDANSRTQGWNMLMGDGYPNGTTQYKYVFDGQANEYRFVQYANGDRLGHTYKDRFEYDNSTGDYSGITLHVLPIRNTTNNQISRTIYTSRTGGGGTYGGHSTIQYNPNNVLYSNTSGGTWTVINNSNYTSESHYNQSMTVTVPANTTILLVNTSGWWYNTTYRFKDSNMFYGLNSFFLSDDSLICDLRMLHTLETGRVLGESITNSNPWKWYNLCAERYGDR